MPTRLIAGAAVAIAVVLVTAGSRTPDAERPSPAGLTVHEWGTFTTVAGPDGQAIDWFPLGGPSDLPCFVERYRNTGAPAPSAARVPNLTQGALSITGKVAFVTITAMSGRPGDSSVVQIGPRLASVPAAPVFDYQATRAAVRGRVRMETPVIYFYSPTGVTAQVRVDFKRGLMTEWYPRATVSQRDIGTPALADTSMRSSIVWQGVRVSPTDRQAYPVTPGASHYYAARVTDAAPLLVGDQQEGFLFYRGVANFDVPIAADLSNGRVTMRNVSRFTVPGAILFENRGGKIGFSVISDHVGAGDRVTFDTPELGRSFGSLRTELERMLVGAGLYPKEAAAMVATWRDSWFEEGTRVLYLYPTPAIDALLPLAVTPAPVDVKRVFVGRMEVITPALMASVEAAAAAGDTVVLDRTARFFGPIADRILARSPSPRAKLAYDQLANQLLTRYVHKVSGCPVEQQNAGALR